MPQYPGSMARHHQTSHILGPSARALLVGVVALVGLFARWFAIPSIPSVGAAVVVGYPYIRYTIRYG